MPARAAEKAFGRTVKKDFVRKNSREMINRSHGKQSRAKCINKFSRELFAATTTLSLQKLNASDRRRIKATPFGKR